LTLVGDRIVLTVRSPTLMAACISISTLRTACRYMATLPKLKLVFKNKGDPFCEPLT
jgi:hypothetical protein